MKNKTDIQESDLAVLEEVHRIWQGNNLLKFKPKEEKSVKKAEQIGLFADTTTDKNSEVAKIDVHDDLGTAIAPTETVKPKRKRR